MPGIKFSEPMRRFIGEKDAEIKKLGEKVKALESEVAGVRGELSKVAAERTKLSAALRAKEAELRDLREKLERSEKRLTRARAGAWTPLEDLVYAYVIGAGGNIDMSQCATALGIKKEQVEDAIDSLVRSGRLGL